MVGIYECQCVQYSVRIFHYRSHPTSEDSPMTVGDRVGLVRYYQTLGQSYAEMFRGSLTAGGVVTAGAAWLGMGKTGALILGVASIAFWQCLAVGFGYAVWRWRVIHATLEREWHNSPATLRQMELLEQIEKNTRR